MNRGEIRDLASVWLDDTSNGYFTVPQLDVFINQAQRECQKLLINAGEDYYTKCATTTTVSGQRDYLLPSDFVKILRIEYVTQGSGDTASVQRLHQITRQEQDVARGSVSGDPTNYFFNKTTFSLVPVPNRVLTMHLYYADRVTDMSNDSDIPDVPEDYHEYLAILAARDGFLKDGRGLGPIESKLAYYEKMMKAFSDQRNRGAARMIVATGAGFGEY